VFKGGLWRGIQFKLSPANCFNDRLGYVQKRLR
jgi:hypothetical protein